jgi:hypothetical protein
MSRERVVIGLLLIALIVSVHALVRTENQRYAMFVGMCAGPVVPNGACLAKVETRTSWWWHLYYALQN